MLDEDHEAYEYVERIHLTSGKASQLIDKVGDTVHTLQDEGTPEAKPLEPIIADVVERVNTKYDRLTIEYDPADFQYEIFAGDLIDSVFSNVLSNAAEHNEGDVDVRIYTEEPTNDTVIVGMADDGSGVSDQVRSELFKMGKKGPDSEGTGFGLGLVRSLVEWYGGDIELRDSESGGADIRLTLRQV
jgi:signal transduction histidine kinase